MQRWTDLRFGRGYNKEFLHLLLCPQPASSTPLIQKQDLWFSTKDTIAKIYDGVFKRVFQEEFEANYQERFRELGLTFLHPH